MLEKTIQQIFDMINDNIMENSYIYYFRIYWLLKFFIAGIQNTGRIDDLVTELEKIMLKDREPLNMDKIIHEMENRDKYDD